VRNLLRPSGWSLPPDTRAPGRRFLLRRGSALFELTRWSGGERFGSIAETLRWLRRLDRDRANARMLSELCRELGAGDRVRLTHDELLVLLARRLVRERWGLAVVEQALNQDVATLPAVARKGTEQAQRPEARYEEEEITGDLDTNEEPDEIEAALDAEAEDGEIEAALDAEAEDGEIEALVLPSAPASPA
jgi:hypothetical protein